jgi:signal transduction histidine kinase
VGTELVVRGKLSRLAEAVANALYRVAHEALVNVELHARATGVVVTLSLNREQAVLTVRDDGVGIDQRQVADWRSQAHFGLRSMARAMEDVGGTFRASPAHPRGLLIEARVPFRDGRPAL